MQRIMARIRARAETADEMRRILTELVEPSRKEPGCLGYELFQDEDNPLEFVTLEEWADQSAADAHMATAHVTEAIARAVKLLAQPPVIHRVARLA